ncbi:uncharacterized protein FOMMEDRAFT_25039 [Fomitiporia mediterranea MF3/22]|uniref:uncharacterized protein n=1 Tax=Fomitiporia mediterranea (strain MF3/22) TaxID=694068 RepID=UPI0004409144|nr:uncharacterized protein FOMMEDRAFT_25039 [Fomitiporia mediterranea MF3/22]EJD07754.1 hypothetical protein FOMMEDRAFT_25039 [Fomitiporia mediterranea MF3/22]
MRCFSLLALAAAAIAPFVGAAPTPAPLDVGAAVAGVAGVHARHVDVAAGAVAGAEVHARHVDVAAGAGAVADVHARNGQKGVQAILIDLKVALGVHIDVLNHLTKDNCTEDILTTHLSAIVKVIGEAVVELKALVGLDISVILCSVDGTVQVAVSVIAELLAEILLLIFGALGFVLTIIADVKILVDVLVAVAFGDCLCGLISVIISLVDGILACLVPLVLGLVSILLTLGLGAVGKVLTIL